jgi:hypothetical protein
MLTTKIRISANRLLRPLGLRVDTLTAARCEAKRIDKLNAAGQFSHAQYPIVDGMSQFDGKFLIEAYSKFGPDVAKLMVGRSSPSYYDPHNPFYSSPDAEVLYLCVRSLRPKTIVEVGSGHSTRVIRQAISDGALEVKHIAIDPEPRDDITKMVTAVRLARLEDIDVIEVCSELTQDDLLFIDSSHEARIASDVAKLFCVILPALPIGIWIHCHDIYLPYDYPYDVASRFPSWGENYMLQAYIYGRSVEVIWPGYYVQRNLPNLIKYLPFLRNGRATSFWFRVCD